MNPEQLLAWLHRGDPRSIARAISLVENQGPGAFRILNGLDRQRIEQALVLGITGPPGAGKSTLTGRLIGHLRKQGVRVGIIAVDPSSPISGGAILGDRIRMMHHAMDPEVVVRSMATRGRLGGVCSAAGAAVRIMAASGCRIVILETVGIGQSEMDIVRLADLTLMVLAPGFGDDIQAMKAGILEVADLLVVNKADQAGAQRLLLDMATVFTSAEEREQRLLATVASESGGTAELLDRILALEQAMRTDNTLQARRSRSFAMETLDQALELLKEPLQREIASISHGSREPRLAAREIIRRLGITKPTIEDDTDHGR